MKMTTDIARVTAARAVDQTVKPKIQALFGRARERCCMLSLALYDELISSESLAALKALEKVWPGVTKPTNQIHVQDRITKRTFHLYFGETTRVAPVGSDPVRRRLLSIKATPCQLRRLKRLHRLDNVPGRLERYRERLVHTAEQALGQFRTVEAAASRWPEVASCLPKPEPKPAGMPNSRRRRRFDIQALSKQMGLVSTAG